MKLRPVASLVSLATAIAITSGNANATVVTGGVTLGSGSFVKLFPPLANPFGAANSVGQDTFQNNNLYAFDEDQNVFVGPGNLLAEITPGNIAGTVLAGTEVASHYVFFDPQSATQTGYVDFDSNILAVFTSTPSLAASDYLANTGVNYLNPGLRGLEPGDSAVIDSTLAYRLNVHWTAASPGDYVRVLTAHSPSVPDAGSTLLLLGCALVGLRGLDRYRKRNSM